MENTFGRWTICDFIGSLPTFDLAVLDSAEEVSGELLEHSIFCEDKRCISERPGLDKCKLTKVKPAKEDNARLSLFSGRIVMRYADYEKSMVHRYRQFQRALEYFSQQPQYTTVCELMANAPAEEIIPLLETPVIGTDIFVHIAHCAACSPAYDIVQAVELENQPQEDRLRDDGIVERLMQKHLDQLSPEKKLCAMITNMNTDQLQTLLFHPPDPEEAAAIRNHAETCETCHAKIDNINFLRNLEDRL